MMRRTLLSIAVVVWALNGAVALTACPRCAVAAEKASKAAGAKKSGGAAASGAPTASQEQIADALNAFCKKWMGFLETRERDNVKGIKWSKQPSKVTGQYVGYSKEYDCTMKDRASNGTPVATIQYKEYVYQKTGGTQSEAEQAQPTVIDATEVTEIFRFTKGEWVY